MIELKIDKVAEYAKKVIGMAKSAGCQVRYYIIVIMNGWTVVAVMM